MNDNVVRGEFSSGFVTSMVKMVKFGCWTDTSIVSGSEVSLFYCSVLEINFLMSSAIIAILGDMLEIYGWSGL